VTAPGPRQTLTIGAVLAALREDFPDISVSKIRFLEAEGLLRPARTGSGYRAYSDDDVARLRYILTAQRDHYWPLKVIRDALDAMDRGLEPPPGPESTIARPQVPAPAEDQDIPPARSLVQPATLRLTREELASSAGLDEPTLASLETFGLVRPDSTGHFGEGALAVAHAAAALAAYGVEPRHLRPFRTAADREIGLVQQVAGPRRGRPTRAGAGGDTREDPTAEVLRHCIALHVALVREGLHRG
jgi:DNA-binding transcriptional MerR regulator